MLPKKQEEPKAAAEPCLLKFGRHNNVVQWREEMQDEACGLHGMTGMFSSTNKSYVHPYPREKDFNPTIPTVGIENEDGKDEGSEDLEDDEVLIDPAQPVAPLVVHSKALIERLRANAFEGRSKAVELQKVNKQKLWPLMWSRMSTGSKSKVREEPGFETCRLTLDSVKLWEFIRRSHLTHVYGEDDSMHLRHRSYWNHHYMCRCSD